MNVTGSQRVKTIPRDLSNADARGQVLSAQKGRRQLCLHGSESLWSVLTLGLIKTNYIQVLHMCTGMTGQNEPQCTQGTIPQTVEDQIIQIL